MVFSSTAATFIDDVQLVVDGETYDDYDAVDGYAAAVYNFDTDGDLVIDAGDEATVEVQVKFNSLALGSEGVTIQGHASSTNIDAEGADDLSGSQLSGSANGETHTLRTTGVTIGDFDWTVSSTGSLIDFTFTIAAEDGDFTIDADTDFATSTSGTATTSNGTLSVLGDSSDVTSNGGNSFTVDEGGEATFRLRFSVTGNNGDYSEVTVTEVAGQEVPSADQTSPTAELDVQS
jgi:hypothetical protein